MNCLSPSILSADFVNLERDIQQADDAGAQYIHIDVMDGHFVPPITIGADVVSAIRGITDKVLDCHLMVENPGSMIADFAAAGADIVTVHAEACTHLDRVVHQIKDAGMMAGVALNPATPLSVLDYVLPDLDMVLLMSVNPGYGGQAFIPYTLQKLDQLRDILSARHLKTDVEVDGGIKLMNVTDVLDAGANIIVAGSAIFHGDIQENVQAFLEKM
ncbi:MAG: ribulose-phosphate 3-epimerase [Lachnospiraceae bacterium]|nr:ribulose-phosphate 3-epimerase [Lachnospiraceae bacterium]MEE3433873.1 ribulose-phosphate 3-epimerase [Lachnospiraceae bacterium]